MYGKTGLSSNPLPLSLPSRTENHPYVPRQFTFCRTNHP
jgi:hypothetical protein